MLGRRLLILAAVLLATGAIAAALTPRDRLEGGGSVATSPAPPPPRPGALPPGTEEVARVVDAAGAERALVRVRQGELLRLDVRAPEPDEVELVGLGRFEPVDQFSPARFEFFVGRAGTFPIRLREAGREIGRIAVQPRPL